MPGINTTGAPNTRDYVLGRGVVYAAKLTAAGLPDSDGFRDLGNAPEFGITVSVEDLRHQSSRDQLKFTDARCTISQEVGVSFVLDEMNFQNLADAFSGTTATYDNPHDTTFAAADTIVSSSVKLGNWYQLKDDNGARVYNIDATGVVYAFSEDPGGTPQALTEGTDFELDKAMGLVRFLPTATNVAEGDEVGFAITTGASTPQDLDQVNALTQADISVALMFIQKSACDGGNKTEYMFHKVSLSSDGDISLIGDEIQTASFTGVAEVNSAITEASKVMRVRTYDQQ